MANVAATSQSMGIANFASGSFTSDNTITTITLGFTPRFAKIVNTTDVIIWEKNEGMPAINAIKTVTAGTTTMDAGSGVLFPTGTRTIVLAAATVGSAKAISWVAHG